LPADDAITPRESVAADKFTILLYAPRHLKENTGCVSSRFRNTRLPSRAERIGATSSRVSIATS
jgi:hypothetical protein